MTATDVASTPSARASHAPGMLARWWRRHRAERSRIDYAVWDLRERYGEAAFAIAQASARMPAGEQRRRFWRKVAAKLRGRTERAASIAR
jgi:hypothetical protein